MKRMSRRREERKVEAVERDEARAGRTPEGQLAVLDARLGDSMGSKRERLRLLREIEKREASANKTSKAKARASPSSSSRSERKKAKARRNEERDRARKGGEK